MTGRRRATRPIRGLALAAVAVTVAACLGTVPSSGRPRAGAASSPDPSAPRCDDPPTVVPDPKHELYGFVPYWEMDGSIADHIAATPLTTLGLFSVTHDRAGELDDRSRGSAASVAGWGTRSSRPPAIPGCASS